MGRVELCEAVARLQESLAAFTGQHGTGRRAWHRQTILPGLRGLLESARQVTRQLAATPELCGGVDFGPYPPLSEAAEAVTTRAARWLKACHAPGFWLNPRWDETATVRHNGKPVTVLVEGGDFGETLGELRDLSGVIDGAGRAMVAHWQRLDDLQAIEDAMAPCPEPMTNAVVAPRNDSEPAAGGTRAAEKPKRCTVANEAREKIIAALSLHHDFDGDSCMNMGYAGGAELARKAGVNPGTVSRFFKREFGGCEVYRGICTRGEKGRLIGALQKLRDEEPSRLGFGDEPINHSGHRRRNAGNRDRD